MSDTTEATPGASVEPVQEQAATSVVVPTIAGIPKPAKGVVVFEQKLDVVSTEEVAAILNDELDGIEDIRFDRVKWPGSGGRAFEVPGDDPDNPDVVTELVGVIVDHHPASALWIDKFSGASNPPDAWSMDGVNQQIREESIERFQALGLPLPSNKLATCPYNQFGSAKLLGEEGDGKATKNMHRVYLLPDGEVFPRLITLPTMSVRVFTDWLVKRIAGRRMKSWQGVTRITLSTETNKGGIAYAQGRFALLGQITDPENLQALAAYSASIKQFTRSVAIDNADYIVADVSDPETGQFGTPQPGDSPADYVVDIPAPGGLDAAFAAATGGGAPPEVV